MSLMESGLVAVLGTSLAIAALRPVAERLNLVDLPNQRKQHVGGYPSNWWDLCFCWCVTERVVYTSARTFTALFSVLWGVDSYPWCY